MPFDWREYLSIAQTLQIHNGSNFTQEAAQRCAVSRAYYAAFCYARNYARDRQNFSPTYKTADHTLVRTHFKNQGMPQIARLLDNLRQWRNDCDYKDTLFNVPVLITSAVNGTHNIIKALK